MVEIGADVLSSYEAFTRYNSPYIAHNHGNAIDLYPGCDRAPSPVAGEVIFVDRVRAPSRPYAEPYDHVIAIDTEPSQSNAPIARILHVEPTVTVGEYVDRGADLGRLVRAGFFAPWVDNHLHLEFRAPESDLRRASGAVGLTVDVTPTPLAWDGRGTVVATGDTYTELAPPMPPPDATWVGLGCSTGDVLDGGLPHYEHGGVIPVRSERTTPISLLDTAVGELTDRSIAWSDLEVRANGKSIHGLSLFCARADSFRIKLITPTRTFPVGADVAIDLVVK